MNWEDAVGVCAALAALIYFIERFSPRRDSEKVLQLGVKVSTLEGKLAAKEIELQTWKDRGSRHSAARDAAEDRLEKIHAMLADIIKRGGEYATLRETLDKVLASRKESR